MCCSIFKLAGRTIGPTQNNVVVVVVVDDEHGCHEETDEEEVWCHLRHMR